MMEEIRFPSPDTDLGTQSTVWLKKGEGRSLKAGGAWIYDNEVARVEGSGNASDGVIAAVRDFDGFFLGRGVYNSQSKIRVRMLSRREGSVITPRFLRKRLENAWNIRKSVKEDTGSCRVVFGDADFLPGLTIDKFADVLVVESLSLGTDRLKLLILALLVDVLAEDGVKVRGIYERSDAKVRALEGMRRRKGFLPVLSYAENAAEAGGPTGYLADPAMGDEAYTDFSFDTEVLISENGISYLVDVKDGQKTGFFLDQQVNRKAVARLCRGKKVLDCFTHTGSFGLNAAAAGAKSVLSVDASDLAIAQAGKNAELNRDLIGDCSVDYLTADVFELLPDLEAEGETFDVVILDPPAFTKSRTATKNAVKGYREINLRGMKLVRDGGYLATCSCSHFMDEELFKKTIGEAAHGAHKRLKQVYFGTQGPDHPILWGDGESYYLKFLIFEVSSEL